MTVLKKYEIFRFSIVTEPNYWGEETLQQLSCPEDIGETKDSSRKLHQVYIFCNITTI
jgi:hypothetical protein